MDLHENSMEIHDFHWISNQNPMETVDFPEFPLEIPWQSTNSSEFA